MPRQSAELAQTQLFPDETKSTTQIQMEVIDIRNNVRRINEEIKAKQAEVNKSKNELKAITKKENDLLDIIVKRSNVEYVFIEAPAQVPSPEVKSDEGPSDAELSGFVEEKSETPLEIAQPENAVFEDEDLRSILTDEQYNEYQAIPEKHDQKAVDEAEVPGDGVDLDEVLNGDDSEDEEPENA